MKPLIVILSEAEARAALHAIAQLTEGNARSYSDWHSQTSGSYAEWLALLRAEAKLIAARTEALRA